jgi:hypothetical protein
MSDRKLQWFRRICLSFLCLFFLAYLLAIVFEPKAEAQQNTWRVELEEGKTASSNLLLNNRCKAAHNFRVEEDMKYLSFKEPTESVLIAPGATKSVGVTFDATGLKPKIYEDDVLIICIDCKTEPTCAQDRDKVPVQLIVKPKPSADNSKNRDDNECQTKMAAETDKYIKEKKIPLKPNQSKFSSNKDEQVYAASSDEPVNLSSVASVPTTFAVINSKDSSGKSVFYTLEREIKPELITYSVKKDSVVIQTADVRIPTIAQMSAELKSTLPVPAGTIIYPTPDVCAKLPALNEKIYADALDKANKTCRSQPYATCFCTKMPDGRRGVLCFTGNSVKPTSPACYWQKAPSDWLKNATFNVSGLVGGVISDTIGDQIVSNF